MDNTFWDQFWPQFWGGVASALFVGILSIVFAYAARLKLARFFVNLQNSVKNVLLAEEEQIKGEIVDEALKKPRP